MWNYHRVPGFVGIHSGVEQQAHSLDAASVLLLVARLAGVHDGVGEEVEAGIVAAL